MMESVIEAGFGENFSNINYPNCSYIGRLNNEFDFGESFLYWFGVI